MPEWIKWVFDGIGTQLIGIIMGLIFGGIGGFVIGKHTKIKQMQKAGDFAKQEQAVAVDNGKDVETKRTEETNTIVQKQKAGDHAEQVQTGSVKHERR